MAAIWSGTGRCCRLGTQPELLEELLLGDDELDEEERDEELDEEERDEELDERDEDELGKDDELEAEDLEEEELLDWLELDIETLLAERGERNLRPPTASTLDGTKWRFTQISMPTHDQDWQNSPKENASPERKPGKTTQLTRG